MLLRIFISLFFITIILNADPADLIPKVPGFSDSYSTKVYSGYLKTADASRQLFYVFVQSANGANNTDPVTLWLNGGPGCSSLLGYLQEVGPYFLQDGKYYNLGDKLTQNEYSWHKASNLLFLQSPAGVGFSSNTIPDYNHTDQKTAQDMLNAVVDFFTRKFSQYSQRKFWIAGQSYAGKYIPDLSVQIDKWNTRFPTRKVNLQGILVGNGVMTFEDDFLSKSTIQYVINHGFVDPQTLPIWYGPCQTDFYSDECGVFLDKFQQGFSGFNPYDVYGYCFVDGVQDKRFYKTQTSVLIEKLNQQKKSKMNRQYKIYNLRQSPQKNIRLDKSGSAPCAYFAGMQNYFTINRRIYNAKSSMPEWNGPCADINYEIEQTGSLDDYRYLLAQKKYKIVLYNGDWDAVVPYTDTLKGLARLNLVGQSTFTPWFTDRQHSGFSQAYPGLLFLSVKGASHQVPQAKRAEALNMFRTIIG